MSSRWLAMVNGVITAMIAALALLILDQPSGVNLTVAVVVGIIAAAVTWVRVERS